MPPGLKDNLLAQIVSAQAEEDVTPKEEPSNIVFFTRSRITWLAAAALVKFFLIPSPVQFPSNSFAPVDTFRDHMAYFANKHFVIDQTTKDLDEAKTWLAEHQSPTYAQTPGPIIDYEGMGCKSFDWGGHTVSLVSFKNSEKAIVHLFVMDKAGLATLQFASPLQEVLV